MTNTNKLYDSTSSFTNDVKLSVCSKKPLNMQAFGHNLFILSLIGLCTVQSKAQIDCMFALRHFLHCAIDIELDSLKVGGLSRVD